MHAYLNRTAFLAAFLAFLGVFLSGCTSTEQTLAPIPGDQASASDPAAADTATPRTLAFPGETSQAANGLSAGSGGAGSIRFTPVIGAPVGAVTPLSRQLALEARNRGLLIRSANDQGGDHILKGYFSAINDDVKTTIVFVWDILDNAGNRLHRIQGQEEVPGAAADAWASVPPAVMERIATRTFAEYVAWRQTAGG